MTRIRTLLLTVAVSAACIALVSDVHGMRTPAQRLAATQAKLNAVPVVVAPVVNQSVVDFLARLPVKQELQAKDDAVQGSRLGGHTQHMLQLKIAFENLIDGISGELDTTLTGTGLARALGAPIADGDAVLDGAYATGLLNAIVAIEQNPDSALDAAGAVVRGRTLDASYADFVATLEHVGGAHGGGHGVLHDVGAGGALAGAARTTALLDHILDASTHIDTYLTNYDGAGSAHDQFAALVLAAGQPHHAEFASDFVARWHFARLILAEHAVGGLTFKAVRALAKVLGGL